MRIIDTAESLANRCRNMHRYLLHIGIGILVAYMTKLKTKSFKMYMDGSLNHADIFGHPLSFEDHFTE